MNRDSVHAPAAACREPPPNTSFSSAGEQGGIDEELTAAYATMVQHLEQT